MMFYLEVKVSYSACVQVLQSFQSVFNEECHLLLHQLIVSHQIVQQTSILNPEHT